MIKNKNTKNNNPTGYHSYANLFFMRFIGCMDITASYTKTNFTSRNKEIRIADKIMRNLKNEYPACSTSRVLYMDVVKKQPQLVRKAYNINDKLFGVRAELSKYTGTELLHNTLKEVKSDKVANCMEMSRMAAAAFLENGYNDVRFGSLYAEKFKKQIFFITNQRAMDHRVLLINAGKNAKLENPKTYSKHAIIVDTWAGFVDYASNAFTRYKAIFNKQLKRPNNERFFLKEQDNFVNTENLNITKLKFEHPELIIKTPLD